MLKCGQMFNYSTFKRKKNRVVEHLNSGTGENAKLRSTIPLLTCSKKRYKMPFMFENLEVYQKSVDLAEKVINLTDEFPKGYYFLTDQLNRASLSIATNIAEGNGRFTKKDRRNFFIIARGSVQECVPLLEIAKRKRLISDVTLSEMFNQLEVISKMISGLINGLERRKTK
jgi:four helix bundle protein